jgi:hypothetical protein
LNVTEQAFEFLEDKLINRVETYFSDKARKLRCFGKVSKNDESAAQVSQVSKQQKISQFAFLSGSFFKRGLVASNDIHYRSDPNGDFNNNWSIKGNKNPYTREYGTKSKKEQKEEYPESHLSLK